ncbi:MAG: TlpA disulfide reductase family protein [Steroidobacteraceae bacterium]
MNRYSMMRPTTALSALLLAGTALLTACARGPAPEAAPDWTGSYRATLQLPGGELPFGLTIRRDGERLTAEIRNGEEKLQVDEVSVADGQIHLALPGFENTLTARRENGELKGELFFVKARGRNQHIPFTAEPGEPRFFATPAAPGGDVSGRWAVTFTGDSGDTSIAVGEFRQQGSDVTGTFLTPTGDFRYLTGELREGQLYLGTFNGGQAFLFHAALSPDGNALDGEFWSGLASHQRFAAHRDASASLGDTTQKTALRQPAERFNFTFPDLDGHPVSLTDPRFAGKVVVVTLAGSWCPNCHDEADFLVPYYRAHRDAGLEVIGLMFEQFDSEPEARAAVARFRDRKAVPYALLIAGISPTDDAATKLPQLNGVFAYPTTLFIDRKGKVRHIHTGFSGPATGEHYTALTQDFDQRISALLAEAP